MKRILNAIGLLCLLGGLSIFFTGCSRSDEEDYVITSGHGEARGQENPGITLHGTEAEKQDIEGNVRTTANGLLEGRFDEVSGAPAFVFPENHSLEDMQQFLVLGLENGYFYYAYVTGDTYKGTNVSCVAKNRYESGVYEILYEKSKPAAAVDSEDSDFSFYCQMFKSKKGETMFSIYDDGDLTVINGNGELIFARTSENSGENMGGLIDRIFEVGKPDSGYFSWEVNNVVTDGRYNFYISVNLMKGDYRNLDENKDLEAESHLLMYSFVPVGGNNAAMGEHLVQVNMNYLYQINYWESTGYPDEKVLDVYPDIWSPYYISFSENSNQDAQLWKWKDGAINFTEDALYWFTISENKRLAVMDIEEHQSLDGYYFFDNKHGYCSLMGKTDTTDLIQLEKTRTYSITTGEGEEESVTTKTDTHYFNYMKKTWFAQGAAFERFDVLTDITNDIFWEEVFTGSEGDTERTYIGFYGKKKYQILTYKKGEDQYTSKLGYILYTDWAKEDITVRILNRLYDDLCIMIYNMKSGKICIKLGEQETAPWIYLNTEDISSDGYRKSGGDEVLLEGMGQSADMREGYHGSGGQYDIENINLYESPEHFGKDNVIVLDENKLLITTFYNGMQLLEMEAGKPSGTAWRISQWPMYQAWMTSPGVVTAIGFDKEKETFQYSDITRARVYTFELDEEKPRALSYKFPQQDMEEIGTGGNGDSGGGRGTLPLPDGMEDLWEEAVKRRPETEKGKEPGGSAQLPTIAPVTILETDEVLGDMWKERESGRK